MPRIDPLISAMMANRAEAVRLSDGEVAYVIKGGKQHPLTRQPLAEGQVALLLREIAPADVAHKIGSDNPVDFPYANADGRFLARVMRDGATLRAIVSPEPGASAPGASAENGHNGNGNTPKSSASNGNGHPSREAGASNGTADVTSAPSNGAAAGAQTIQKTAFNPAARNEVESLLRTLLDESASDLHLRVGEPPILRVHGELKRLATMKALTPNMVEAMVFCLMPERNQVEFRDSNDTDFAHEIEGLARFRVNAFRDHHGVGAVFRAIPATVGTADELGITPEVQNLCYLTKGLVLVTGPTGSGKSTTLASLIDLINRTRNDHVITIEDPIEFVHKNKMCVITQRQVGMHTGSFKSALRAALREDPDIVLVGELRDLETISIALETAETGHLVFGTLHTTTAPGTIDRIIDQFPADRQAQIRVMLADTLKGVISQTLCKKVGGGRVAAREILLSLPAVSNMIREGKAFQIPSVIQTSRKLGMIQLGDVLIDLVDQGVVTPQEGFLRSTDKTAFMTLLKNRGHDTTFSMTS
ncbi:MAG TPA: PilT/PilU family type 4a pilus ATPase [Gemmatimonadaceae bacterium]|nr:PilT/PilU family type 4a pilus ATPase [Gemmatimonadaceae bacterium]